MKINKKMKIPLMRNNKNNNNDNINSMFFNDRMNHSHIIAILSTTSYPKKKVIPHYSFPFQSMMMIKKKRVNK